GALWVHMIEKAYAASGLHQKDPVFKTDPEKNVYRRIEGGKSSEFIRKLTGKEEKITKNKIISAVNVNGFFYGVDGVKLWQMNQQNQNKDNPAYDCIDDIKLELQRWLKGKYLMKYKGVEYSTKAITIEDVEREVYRMAEWLPDATKIKINENYKNYRMQKGSGAGSDNGKMDYYTYLKKIEEILIDMTHQEGSPFLEYKSFAVQEDEQGKKRALYTHRAENCYENIKNALKANIPVAVGTKSFIPAAVSSSGLNGEAEAGGLVEGHVYSVIGAQEISGRKYIQLRNPWGRKSRGYEKIVTPGADGAPPQVTYRAKTFDFWGSEQKGQFLMELNDLVNTVDEIYGIKDAFDRPGGDQI
ncbi:MAG: C2 family cysteine protease, partial [Bacillota bacterium]|nr:C2 family cysteine protease [Bacillota bacterium]